MIHLNLPSDLDSLIQIDDIIENIRSNYGIGDEVVNNLMMAFHEALTNAILHGNQLDPSKTVDVKIDKVDHNLVIEITDQGNGFKPDELPDPLSETNLMKSGGRGVFLIHQFADEVRYNDKGNQVSIIYHLHS
jgi:serine/threonine-protein kinase RsbW